MKKLFCVLALLLVLPRAGAVSARAAVVIDADTGETLFEQNADSRLPMASTTKIMTALVALGEGDLDRVYTVKPEYAAVEGSSMYLKAGETLSLQDTLYGLMLASGNDAAECIAAHCGGSGGRHRGRVRRHDRLCGQNERQSGGTRSDGHAFRQSERSAVRHALHHRA